MKQDRENLITVLDAGSAKVCVLVAEVQDGVLRYRGHGVGKAKGMRKGLIADLGPASEVINEVALTAERIAKAPIESAIVGIGGTHVRGINSRGGISMGNRMREITREEVRAAVDRARSIPLPPDREVLHLLPQDFIVDDLFDFPVSIRRREMRHLVRMGLLKGRAGRCAGDIGLTGGMARQRAEAVGQAQHVRHRDVGDREGPAGEPLALGQNLLHPPQTEELEKIVQPLPDRPALGLPGRRP